MSFQKSYIFDPLDLVQLLVHYTDGEVPLNGVVTNVGFHPALKRFIGIEIESDEFDTTEPLHIRYQGKKILSWAKGDGEQNWVKANEATRQ